MNFQSVVALRYFSSVIPFCCLLAFIWLVPVAQACDLCAIYTARESELTTAGSFRLGTSQQFTDYSGTASEFAALSPVFLQEQKLKSSITQFFGQYSFSERISLQLTIPYIYRDYDRLERGRMKSGDEYGFGDLSAIVNYRLLDHRDGEGLAFWGVYAGMKLPTGDDGRLSEEQSEEAQGAIARLAHGVPNGNLVDGADLALGTGSFDFPLGSSFLVQCSRLFVQGNIQLALRTEGGYDFQYGNGIFFDFGPGVHILLEHPFAVAARVKLSGDFKEKDKLSGSSLQGSSQNLLFLGPELTASIGSNWNLALGADFNIQDDSQSQGVQPNYRINASLTAVF